MSIARNMQGVGLQSLATQAIIGTLKDNLTAAGTTQANAYLISNDHTIFTNVTVGGGARLPIGDENDTYTIRNDSANAMLLYPPVGGSIDEGAVDAPMTIPAGQAVKVFYQTYLTIRVDSFAVVGAPVSFARLSQPDGATLVGYGDSTVGAELDSLRDDVDAFSSPGGASLIGYGGSNVAAKLDSFAISSGSNSIGFIQEGAGAVGRTSQEKLREFVSVKDFGAVGDGVTDDTSSIQAALNSGAKRVYSPPGIYVMGFVTIPSGLDWFGAGSSTVKKAIDTLATNAPMVRNTNFGSYTDSGVSIRDMVFDGANVGAGVSQTRFESLLHFWRVTGLKLVNVGVQNGQYQGIALSGCRRVEIIAPTLTGLGYTGTTSNGGSALWIGSVGSDMSSNINVSGGTIFDNNWHGIHAAGQRVRIVGVEFRNNKEAHIYAPRTLPNTDTNGLLITNFVMDGLRRKDISAHAIETEARDVTIANGQISDCDHGGIALQNSQNVEVTGMTIKNVNKINGSWGGIDIITDNAAPNQPKDITIGACRIYDDQGTPTTQAAVRMQNNGASVTGLSMVGNNFGGTFKAGGAAFQPNGKLGAGAKIKSNIGVADNPAASVFGQFSVTATGNLSITGLGFKPVRLKISAILPGASLKKSDGWIAPDGSMFSQNITSTATPAAYGGIGAYAVNVTNGLGAADTRATWVSYDADGFTLNFSVVAPTTWCIYEAFPD